MGPLPTDQQQQQEQEHTAVLCCHCMFCLCVCVWHTTSILGTTFSFSSGPPTTSLTKMRGQKKRSFNYFGACWSVFKSSLIPWVGNDRTLLPAVGYKVDRSNSLRMLSRAYSRQPSISRSRWPLSAGQARSYCMTMLTVGSAMEKEASSSASQLALFSTQSHVYCSRSVICACMLKQRRSR